MIKVIRALCVTSALLCLPMPAAAGTGVPPHDDPGQAAGAGLPRAADEPSGAATGGRLSAAGGGTRDVTGPPAPRRQSAAPSGRRDSLWNGVLVGAGLGALIGAVGGQAILECSECAGFNVPLTFGVIGAGVGAGIGAGIDALRQTRSPIPITPARITIAPLVGKRQRAVVAVVRF